MTRITIDLKLPATCDQFIATRVSRLFLFFVCDSLLLQDPESPVWLLPDDFRRMMLIPISFFKRVK